MLTILAEYMKTHSGRMKVVGVAGVISRLVPCHPGDAQGGAGGGGRILYFDYTCPCNNIYIKSREGRLCARVVIWSFYCIAFKHSVHES